MSVSGVEGSAGLGGMSVNATPIGERSGGAFQAILRRLEGVIGANTANPSEYLLSEVRSSKALSPRELIALQVYAGEVGLRVELVARIAESALSAFRRLQQPQ
ncbi:MAG: hypothetical protein RL417_1036 [Pseudomonadota bacterium]|jgi:hypothetical protein